MRLKLYCLPIFLILLLTGCAQFRRADKSQEELFVSHWRTWQKFSLEGIAEVQFGQLRLRKHISIIRKENSLSMVMFDSGLFGLRPTPFVSVEIDSTAKIELSEALRVFTNDTKIEMASIDASKVSKMFNAVEDHKEIIVRDRKLELDSTTLLFNESMRLINLEISVEGQVLSISLRYGRDGNLERLILSFEEEEILNIIVDTIKYG